MNIRLSNNNDHKKIRSLWELVFPEDSKEYLDFYFNVVMKENQVIIAEDIKKDTLEVVAMLHLNPYSINSEREHLKIFYIVAVATRSDYRRRGLMRKMLTYAEELSTKQNVDYLILLPADERYYKPFGYQFASKQYNTTIYTEKYLNECTTQAYANHISNALTYKEFERCFLNNHFENEDEFSPIQTSELALRIYQETRSENGQIYEIDGNLILLYQFGENKEKKIEVRKIYYNKNCNSAKENYKKIKQFLLHFADGKPIIIHEVEERKVTSCFAYNRQNDYDCRPYMMIKKCSNKKAVKNIYFDEMV
jgi:predicted N-acetyltransferase YhbS